MNRLHSLSALLRGAQRAGYTWPLTPASTTLEATPAGRILKNLLGAQTSSFHTSSTASQATEPDVSHKSDALSDDSSKRYRHLSDKELWHEAWMYEDRFGTEEAPIVVPSLEAERIIGVTDPEDDNLVVWGILRENDPPRQFIEGGEFYVLRKVDYVTKVGDVLEQLEAGKASTPISA